MQTGYWHVNIAMQEQETVYHFQGVYLSRLQLFDIFGFRKSREILSQKDEPSSSGTSTQLNMIGVLERISPSANTCVAD